MADALPGMVLVVIAICLAWHVLTRPFGGRD